MSDHDPLFSLLTHKGAVTLAEYVRVNDATVWYHIDRWSQSDDEELRFHADRLRRRTLPKPLALPEEYAKTAKLVERAKELVRDVFPRFAVDQLVVTDQPSRRVWI